VRVDSVIHLYRNPGDYMKSTIKQTGDSCRVFFQRMASYRLFHRLARRTSVWVPYRPVTYEGLADDTAGTLDTLFRFVRVAPKSVAELVSQEWEERWHFMGDASLFGFDGTIWRSQHDLTKSERRMVSLLRGRYDGQKIYLTSRP
jgi:hypothetical protein